MAERKCPVKDAEVLSFSSEMKAKAMRFGRG